MSDLKNLWAKVEKEMKDGEFFWHVRPTRSKISPLRQPNAGPTVDAWSGQLGSTKNSEIGILVGPALSEEDFLREAIEKMRREGASDQDQK